jgi:hypothetical protein
LIGRLAQARLIGRLAQAARAPVGRIEVMLAECRAPARGCVAPPPACPGRSPHPLVSRGADRDGALEITRLAA